MRQQSSSQWMMVVVVVTSAVVVGVLSGMAHAQGPGVAVPATPTSTPTPDERPWKYIDCHKGIYDIEGYKCKCPVNESWTGVDCSVCGYNSCPQGQSCDSSIYLQENKHYNCTPHGSIRSLFSVGATQFQCIRSEKTCNFQGFAHPDAAPVGVNCTFTECEFDNDYDGLYKLRYQCQKTKCHATAWCNDIAKTVIAGMKGPAQFQCHPNATCQFTQQEFPLTVPLSCVAGECRANKPKVDPPTNWVLVGSLSGGAVVVIFAVYFVQQWWVKREAELREQYHRVARLTTTLSWDDVGYVVEARNAHGQSYQKQILRACSGEVKPGEVLAIIGPSGAGKTTLLDILANRKTNGVVSGRVLVNGEQRTESFTRVSGYVLQEDIMMPTLTVREQLSMYAHLRLPPTTPSEVREETVDRVMAQLGISHIAHSRIGDEMTRGISGGERKRVNLASELVTDPSLLFLDEPTTGLDATAASSLIRILTELAKEEDRTVVFSIHQPRSNIFHMFDKIMLLAATGQVVYYGAAQDAVAHFARLGFPCPIKYNPADFLIDLISEKEHIATLVKAFESMNNRGGYTAARSYKAALVLPEVDVGMGSVQGAKEDYEEVVVDGHAEEEEEMEVLEDDGKEQEEEQLLGESLQGLNRYATGFWTQLYVLSWRSWLNVVRNPALLRATYGVIVLLGLLLGYAYYQLSLDIAGVQNRAGIMFFSTVLFGFSSVSGLDTLLRERALFTRERANATYRPSAYFISKVIFDILPLRVVPPLIFGAIAYPMMGLRAGSMHVFYFLLILVLVNVVAASLCFAIGAASPNIGVANLVAIVVTLLYMLFGGFLLNKDSIPAGLSWLQYASYVEYAFESLCVNELSNTAVVFDPSSAGFNNTHITINGNVFLQQFGLDLNRFSMDIYVLAGMAVGYLVVAFVVLEAFVKEKR